VKHWSVNGLNRNSTDNVRNSEYIALARYVYLDGKMDGIVIDLSKGVVMVMVVVDGCGDEEVDECALFFILRFFFFASNDRR
jgi:hypothetical protein